ncbi:MAG: Smr/MutS family protein [Acetobacter fabarum]|nr:Smr/MutS family protein [Acetobacter fabarum]MCI1908522.1 Smr/MutS family protein [Acetobacter fabarum]MCI1926767.1 Smr/MutS family protein [Acetobacter fabarum]MCI1988012.1 Smr/MutS family protein [Acetobacter fabarum]MCI2023148.1 Smr/MutS family protein [Acetobacter fabarum]
MVKRRRQLQEAEKQLWALVVRDVAPLTSASLVPPMADTAFGRDAPPVPEGAAAIPQTHYKKNPPKVRPAGSLLWEVRPTVHPAPAVAPITVRPAPPIAEKIGQRQPGVDDYSWRRFHQGSMRVEKRLDLHGMVAQEAFVRLREFMDAAAHRGLRCVEIITGLGTGQEGGILRRELPHWLERPEMRASILGLAYPHEGNKGSVRILLRRRRR